MGPIIQLAICAAALVGLWKTFEKCGHPGWAGIIPFYNLYILTKIVNRPAYWVAICLIPFAVLVLTIDLARLFGKSTGFGIGLGLLGFVFFPILGFGDAKFQGTPAQQQRGFAPIMPDRKAA
jgi:hypothetical protein